MLKKGRLALASTFILLLAALVAACGGGTTTTPPPGPKLNYQYKTPTHKGGTILFSDWEFPDSSNPWFATVVVDNSIINSIWGGPLVVSSDGQLLPDELTRIPTQANGDVSKDGLTVTMKLKTDLKWSDGQPLTSADFKYWWTVDQDPNTGAASTSGYDQITSIDTPDTHTVVLHYKTPFAPYLFYLPNAAPQHVWGNIANKDLLNTQDVNLTPKVSSGPYVVQDYASGQSLTMVPNKNYSSTTLHPTVLDKLVFKGYQSKDAMIADYQAGGTDQAEDFTVGDLQKLNNLPGLIVATAFQYEHVDFNLTNPVLKDVNVRKAIYQAIDRCTLIQSLLSTACDKLILNTLEPCPHPDCNPDIKGFAFDLAAAKNDMKAAGWDCSASPCTKGGQPFPTLNLVTTSGNTLRKNATELIKANLDALGIKVNLDGQYYPAGVLFGAYAAHGILATGKYDLALFAYSESVDSDGNFYGTYVSDQIPSDANPSGTNYERTQDPQIDKYLKDGRTTLDPSKRTKIYKDFQAYFMAQAYTVPLYERANISLTSTSIGNFFMNPSSAGNQWNISEWFTTKTS